MKKNDNLEKNRFNILSANKVQSLDKAEKGESLEKGYALMKEAGNAFFKKIKEAESYYYKNNPCYHCGPGNGCDDCRDCKDSKIS